MQTKRSSRFLFIRIVVVFGLLLGSYYAFAATESYETRVFQPYVAINASMAGSILAVLGYEIDVEGDLVASPEFAVRIGKGCDGLEAMAFFVAAVLAFSSPILLKFPALLIGIPLLVGLNLVRVVSLFLVGIYYPALFHTMHVDVWQVLYILVSIVLFGLWLVWATSTRVPAAADSG